MAIETSLNIIIKALDQASAPLRNVAKELKGVNADTKGWRGSLDGLNGAVGDVNTQLEAARDRCSNVTNALNGAARAAAVVAAAITGALLGAVVAFVRTGDELETMSQRTGVSVEALGALKYAVAGTGASLGDIESALKFLAKNAYAASQATDKTAGSLQAMDDTSREAAQSIEDAQRSLGRAVEDSGRDIEKASDRVRETVEDAAYSQKQSLQRVSDAYDRVTEAALDAEKAQARAAQDNARMRRDLSEQSADFEERSSERILAAQKRLMKADTWTEWMEAQESLRSTTQDVERDRIRMRRDAGERISDSEQRQAEAAEDAQKRQIDAQKALADAQEDAAHQQIESAKQIAAAQEASAETQVAAAQRVEDANRSLARTLENVASQMSKASAKMEEGEEGGIGAAAAFKKLGVSVTDASGKLKDPLALFIETTEALRGVSNRSEQLALAYATLGRNSMTLIPIINSVRGGMAGLIEEGMRSGVMTAEQAQQASELGKAWGELKVTAMTLAAVIGSQLTDGIKWLVQQLGQAIAWVRQWIADHPTWAKALVYSAVVVAGLAWSLSLLLKTAALVLTPMWAFLSIVQMLGVGGGIAGATAAVSGLGGVLLAIAAPAGAIALVVAALAVMYWSVNRTAEEWNRWSEAIEGVKTSLAGVKGMEAKAGAKYGVQLGPSEAEIAAGTARTPSSIANVLRGMFTGGGVTGRTLTRAEVESQMRAEAPGVPVTTIQVYVGNEPVDARIRRVVRAGSY